MPFEKMNRVTKTDPCPVCGKPDWCLVADDGSAAICQRIEDDSVKQCGDAGWLHILKDCRYQPRAFVTIAHRPVNQDLSAAVKFFQAEAKKTARMETLAKSLGLSVDSLRRFAVGWSPRDAASTWPMSDATGRVIGINRRFADGSKRIFRRHRAGLYMPVDLPQDLGGKTLLVCEGATDAAAGLDCGFWAVGRFSCLHGKDFLKKLLQNRGPDSVVIVADGDGPGQQGAEGLASALLPYTPALKIVRAGAKDLREWKQAGATHVDLAQAIAAADFHKLRIRGTT